MSLTALLVATFMLTSLPVFAQAPGGEMTDEHIARIKANCQAAMGTIGRIHAYDAPTYINRNQTYFSISDKMMARMNARLAVNRYDASALVKTASNYNDALAQFRSAYKLYDDSMADVLRMDCKRQPVTFYDKVRQTRDQRQKVNDAVVQLKTLIDQYEQGVQSFQIQHAAQLSGVRS